MLSPHIVSALAAMREADLERRAELARRRRTRVGRRRRHLRLV